MIQDLKVTNQLNTKKVQSLSNYPSRDGVTAEQLKKFFDWPEQFIEQFYNPLIDELSGTGLLEQLKIGNLGIEQVENVKQALELIYNRMVVKDSDNAKHIRIENNRLQVSPNGSDWVYITPDISLYMKKSEFVSEEDPNAVNLALKAKQADTAEKAKDSDKLGGISADQYAKSEILQEYMFMSDYADYTGRVRESEYAENANTAEKAKDSDKLGGTPANEYAKKSDLGGAGTGDMVKAVYDQDNDGKVDDVNFSNVKLETSEVMYDTHSGEVDNTSSLNAGTFNYEMRNFDGTEKVATALTEFGQSNRRMLNFAQWATGKIKALGEKLTGWDDIQNKPSSFPPSSHDHGEYLGKDDKAKDSLKLGGKNASDYLLTTGKAADSNLLDGIDSSGFVQQKQNTLSLQQLNSPNFPQSYVGTTNLGKQIGLPVEWVNIQFVRHQDNGYGTQIAYSTVQSNTQTDTNYFFMAVRSSEAYSWNGWRFIGSHESIAIKDTKLAIRNGHTYVCVWNATVGMPWGDNHDDGVIVPHIGYYNADGSPQWGWQTLYCWNKNEVWVRRINASAWQAWEKIPKWSDLESLKQSSVDGKNTHINGINRLMGYNSGLSVNNSWNDVAWWWEHKVLKEKGNSFSKSYQLRNEQYQSSDDSMDFAIRFNAKELPTLATVNIPAGQTINYTIPQGVSAIAITQKYRNFSSLGFGGSTVISTNILDRDNGTYELSGGWRGFTPQKSSEGFWRGMVITRIYPNRIIQFQNRFGSNTLTAYIKLLF